MDAKNFAKGLRTNMTDAEKQLWFFLRAHRLNGSKFRRQHVIGPYIADFVHFEARVIVEADGGQHNDNTRDAKRDAWFATQGFRVLRFWNNEILTNTEGVLQVILETIESTHSELRDLPSPLAGEGSGERG